MTPVRVFPFPKNKRFAFSIVDDTDDALLESVKASYEFLDELGIKATKTVWVFPSAGKSGGDVTGKLCGGVTLADPGYLTLIRELQRRGHEIALHSASGGNSLRQGTIDAYEIFKREFGSYPVLNAMHGRNRDNLYYGKEAFSGFLRYLVGLYSADTSEGHFPSSPFFWGDICATNTRYVRFYKSTSLNTLRINPSMPYHDPAKPFVRRWFSLTDLADSKMIERNLTAGKIDRLARQRGACIAYTYVHRYLDGSSKIIPVIRERLELVAGFRDDAWFTPASPLLDRLELIRNIRIKKNRGVTFISNLNPEAVGDVWVGGPAGTRVFCENGVSCVIGPSGVGQFIEVLPASGEKPAPLSARLRKGEELRMILSQAYLLLLRHTMGRPFRRKGF